MVFLLYGGIRPTLSRRIILWFFAFGLALCQGGALAQERQPVRIGVLAYSGSEAALADWSHVTAHLDKALPAYHFSLGFYDVKGLEAAVDRQEVSFVITNGGHYVSLEAEYGVSRIATLETPDAVSPEQAIGSAVIARAARHDLAVLADLKGKRLAAVSPDAFGGYLVAVREFRRAGIEPEYDMGSIEFVGFPMQRVVQAVADGRADAGIVRACLLETMARNGMVDLADFKVLSPRPVAGFNCGLSSELYPDWLIATTRATDRRLAGAVATALLSVPPTPDGFSWGVPADYRSVHELYRELKTGPYTYLRETTLSGLARRYWHFLLIGFLAFAGWVIHVVRVEYLVYVRTAELRRALTARDEAEVRMREHQEQAEHLSRLSILGEMSGTLAHELNQPLTTISNYAQSLLRRQASGRLTPEAVEEAGTSIAAQAERAGGILRRIRGFSRKRAAVRDRQLLADIVQEAVAMFSGMLAHAPPVTVDNQLDAGAMVEADALQVEQVLLNLLKNAADAVKGLPEERHRIEVGLSREGAWYRVSVRDRGPGLPEPQRARLFEAFFTTKPDGMGLGLSICKTIVEAHGGRLWADANADGPGLTFTFTLPAHDTSA